VYRLPDKKFLRQFEGIFLPKNNLIFTKSRFIKIYRSRTDAIFYFSEQISARFPTFAFSEKIFRQKFSGFFSEILPLTQANFFLKIFSKIYHERSATNE